MLRFPVIHSCVTLTLTVKICQISVKSLLIVFLLRWMVSVPWNFLSLTISEVEDTDGEVWSWILSTLILVSRKPDRASSIASSSLFWSGGSVGSNKLKTYFMEKERKGRKIEREGREMLAHVHVEPWLGSVVLWFRASKIHPTFFATLLRWDETYFWLQLIWIIFMFSLICGWRGRVGPKYKLTTPWSQAYWMEKKKEKIYFQK